MAHATTPIFGGQQGRRSPAPGESRGPRHQPLSGGLKGRRKRLRHPFRVLVQSAGRPIPGVSPRAGFLRPFGPPRAVTGAWGADRSLAQGACATQLLRALDRAERTGEGLPWSSSGRSAQVPGRRRRACSGGRGSCDCRRGVKRGTHELDLRVVTIIDLLRITIIDVSRGLQRAVVPVASSRLSRIVVPFPLVSRWWNGDGPMISLRPSLITERHSVSNLNDLAREASPCPRDLRPAHDEETTYTVGGNCSRVDGDKRREHIEPRSDSPDASVDPADARKSTVRRFGRCDRDAQSSTPARDRIPDSHRSPWR